MHEYLLSLLILLIPVVGALGVYAIVMILSLRGRIQHMEEKFDLLQKRLNEIQPVTRSSAHTEPAKIATPAIEGDPFGTPAAGQEPVLARSLVSVQESIPSRSDHHTIEEEIGSRWLNWVGILFVMIGFAFFLRYTFDNDWIGPLGRVALGAALGIASIAGGLWAHRRGYVVLFHTLCGGGLAVLYICIFFSAYIYEFIVPSAAYLASAGISILSVTLAILYNAQALCLLGQTGGYLSPILLAAGFGQPILFWVYILIINGTAMGCALFRSWRFVNTLAFIATTILFFSWLLSEKILPTRIALIFATLFYLLFIVLPLLRYYITRTHAAGHDLALVAAAALAVFLQYSIILADASATRHSLMVLFQAVCLFCLAALYYPRHPGDRRTISTLLTSAFALLVLVIPIYWDFYAVSLGWAMEALLFAWIAYRYSDRIIQALSLTALTLSAITLLEQLPLHDERFILILNAAFASWLFVILVGYAIAWLSRHTSGLGGRSRMNPAAYAFVLSFLLTCLLLHLEIRDFWWVRRPDLGTLGSLIYIDTSTVILWSLISLALLEFLHRWKRLNASALFPYVVGAWLVLMVLTRPWASSTLPILHTHFIARAFFIVTCLWGAYRLSFTHSRLSTALEMTGHSLAVLILAMEMDIWTDSVEFLSSAHQYGFTSMLWSLYALGLILAGLWARRFDRRLAGFILLGITIAKILVIDMSVVQPVYRILSFIACGVVLILIGFIYQKYARGILDRSAESGARIEDLTFSNRPDS